MGTKCLLAVKGNRDKYVKHPAQCPAYSKQLATMMTITIMMVILGQDRKEWTGRAEKRLLRAVSEEQVWEADRAALGAPLPEGRVLQTSCRLWAVESRKLGGCR